MRTLIIASLAIALNFSHAAVAQAEQGCPDGYAPSVGTPGQQCVPIPRGDRACRGRRVHRLVARRPALGRRGL